MIVAEPMSSGQCLLGSAAEPCASQPLRCDCCLRLEHVSALQPTFAVAIVCSTATMDHLWEYGRVFVLGLETAVKLYRFRGDFFTHYELSEVRELQATPLTADRTGDIDNKGL